LFAEQAIMRTIVLVAIALAGMSFTSTFADAGTWCGIYRLGSANCGYSSSEECMATVRGLGNLLPESIARDGLRDLRRELESPGIPKALSARLLARRAANGSTKR
jgi:hypothetical protein